MHEIVFLGRVEAWGMRSNIDVGRAYAERGNEVKYRRRQSLRRTRRFLDAVRRGE